MAYPKKQLRAGRRGPRRAEFGTSPQRERRASVEARREEVDLRLDNFQTTAAAPALAAYDSRPVEDFARRTIAFMLIGVLFVVIGSVLIMVALGSIRASELKEFAVILGPVITLVSAATGFYYGTKSK